MGFYDGGETGENLCKSGGVYLARVLLSRSLELFQFVSIIPNELGHKTGAALQFQNAAGGGQRIGGNSYFQRGGFSGANRSKGRECGSPAPDGMFDVNAVGLSLTYDYWHGRNVELLKHQKAPVQVFLELYAGLNRLYHFLPTFSIYTL